MVRLARTALVALALSTWLAAAPQDASRLDFEGLAKSFLAEQGLADWAAAGPGAHGFDELLDSPAYVRLSLGTFDLRVPRKSLEDGQTADEFKSVVQEILDLQTHWLEWKAPTRAAECGDDWKALAKWVKGWSKSKLARVDGGRTLYEGLAASEAVRAAAQHVAEALRADDATCQAVGELGRIVYAPSRKDFVQTLAVAAWFDPSLRANFWSDKVIERTLEWVGWTQVVSFRYTTLPVDAERPYAGVDMSADDKTGFAQYMTERAAALLLRREFWRQDAHFFEQTLAADLVVANTGKNNLRSGEWKLELHTSGSTSQPYERFVPGGNPAGGTLPPNPAGPGTTSGNATQVSLYRTSEGSDYFFGPLRQGQIAGAKSVAKDKKRRLADDKTAHFALYSFTARGEYVVTAPFLGQLAETQPLPPNDYLDDYEEFFRAYRAGFLQWLRTSALPGKDESQAKFAELIAAHGGRSERALIDVSVQEVYGVPLSAMDPSSDSLEWRYLAWLSKKK